MSVTANALTTEIVRELEWARTESDGRSLVWKEWLVTNGLGGYASGTVSGALTRRYHALLVAGLAGPFGRTVMLNYVWERLRWPDGRVVSLPKVVETSEGNELDSTQYLIGFRLEMGLPVWTYDVEGVRFEKRVLMPHLQNTTHISHQAAVSSAPTATTVTMASTARTRRATAATVRTAGTTGRGAESDFEGRSTSRRSRSP